MSRAGQAAAGGGLAQRPLGALLLLTAIFFINFISRIVQAPLMPVIEAELGIGHGAAGSLFLVLSVGYFVTLVGSSFLCAVFTHRQMILISAGLLGLALLATGASRGLNGMRLGLLVVGMAAGLYLPSGIATLTTLVDQRLWGRAIAVHELAPNLSFVAAPLVAEAILARAGWRSAFVLLGAAAICLALVFWRFGRGGEFRGQAPRPGALGAMLGRPSIWVLVVLFGLGISGTLGLFTMLPLYLISEHGLDRNWANTLVSVSRVSGMGMALLGGWAVDRFGTRRVLAAVMLASGGATLGIALARGGWLSFLVFLQPMLAVCFFPAGLAALSRVCPPQMRNVAVSLVSPLGFLIGGGLVPAAVGLSGETASFSLGIAAVGAVTAMGALLPRFLRYQDQSAAGAPGGSPE